MRRTIVAIFILISAAAIGLGQSAYYRSARYSDYEMMYPGQGNRDTTSPIGLTGVNSSETFRHLTYYVRTEWDSLVSASVQDTLYFEILPSGSYGDGNDWCSLTTRVYSIIGGDSINVTIDSLGLMASESLRVIFANIHSAESLYYWRFGWRLSDLK